MGISLTGGQSFLLAQTEEPTDPTEPEAPSRIIFNRAEATYKFGPDAQPIRTSSNPMSVNGSLKPSTPPSIGRVTLCNGDLFNDYSGFKVALYEATGPLQTDLGPLVSLDPAATLPLIPMATGVNPNNENPFDLGDTELLDPSLRGQYNFRLRPDQVSVGQAFILMVTPAPGNFVDERPIQIRITAVTDTSFSYTVTALDDQPPPLANGYLDQSRTLAFLPQTKTLRKTSLKDPLGGASILLNLLAAEVPLCQQQAIAIQKTANQATVEPGGIAIYRLAITNRTTTNLENVEVRDRLPLGFQLIEDSVQGAIGENPAALNTAISGQDITFTFLEPLPGGEPPENNPLTRIVYAVEVTPDAIRGDGRNVAFVEGQREDINFTVRDGPAVYVMGVRDGLISDLGTIVGRVFEDKNFDGEQQYGEPGIPNAVVFFNNGNRIVTDNNGLFSISNVLPGWHSGALDLTSVPGYAPAPNETFIAEDRSYSRTVRLEPGGLARLNFAVTPLVPGAAP
ncbi:hypothetical protein NIES970_28250 (plasmid) [[Synechococcus] sp. NIES-970]|nr:hypothetical protein NIES970_28250 [[Synechococcus] sp. NIES-970]